MQNDESAFKQRQCPVCSFIPMFWWIFISLRIWQSDTLKLWFLLKCSNFFYILSPYHFIHLSNISCIKTTLYQQVLSWWDACTPQFRFRRSSQQALLLWSLVPLPIRSSCWEASAASGWACMLRLEHPQEKPCLFSDRLSSYKINFLINLHGSTASEIRMRIIWLSAVCFAPIHQVPFYFYS